MYARDTGEQKDEDGSGGGEEKEMKSEVPYRAPPNPRSQSDQSQRGLGRIGNG